MEFEDEKIVETRKLKRYSGKFKIGKNKKIACYSKKQFKAMYKNDKPIILGEYVGKSKLKAEGKFLIEDEVYNFYKYKDNKRFVYSEKGYLKCTNEEDTYIVLLKNVFPIRIIWFFLLIALIIGGIYTALNWNSVQDAINKRLLDLDPNAVNWEGQLPESSGGDGIKIPGYKDIQISANTRNVKVSFVNPEGNPCYFVISILLNGNEEIYKSKMIPPGKGLYDIKLTRALKPGTYDAVIKYSTFGLEEYEDLNGANVNIKLIAK